MSEQIFLDTNVLVYLFDSDAPVKQARAREIIETEALGGRALISTQVLQEFYVCITRKLAEPLDPEIAHRAVEDFSVFPIVQVDVRMILSAIQRNRKDKISFWDALIVQAAIHGGAKTIYTEDLQHGRELDGLKIENPFADLKKRTRP